MLIASAGFGKTTLAEQWTRQGDRVAAWYRVREAAVDVAVLGTGLAKAAAGVCPGCERRIGERLLASPSPRDESALLAEILAEDLVEWPDAAWLVLDDYHVLSETPEAELFVETIARMAPVNMLITSRCRPSWVSIRSILYGDVFELGQTALAMNREEALDVLDGWKAEQASGLIALAEGWPAVVGLAGILPLPTDPKGDVPDALYEFFADEVFQALEPDVRDGLCILAVAPTLDRELIEALLGAERGEQVLEEGLRTGILDENDDGTFEFHPLARTFLDQRTSSSYLSASKKTAVEQCVDWFRGRHNWSAVFNLLERSHTDKQLESLLEEAYDELLNTGRLATLETWVSTAERLKYEGPVFILGRAELCLRAGEHLAAQTLAVRAARSDSAREEIVFLGLSTAAGAAHVAGDEDSALKLFDEAAAIAPTPRHARKAAWGKMMCLTELESSEAESVLADLAASTPEDDPREVLLEAGRRLGLELKCGVIRTLDRARLAEQLIPYVHDALVRLSFRSVLATALNMSVFYSQALRVARDMIEDAEEQRLEFVMPYALTAAAAAHAGMRQEQAATDALDKAEAAARRINSDHALLNAHALRLRVLSQARKPHEACRLRTPTESVTHAALRSELHSSRALALASCGRGGDASDELQLARGLSRCIESKVLIAAVDAILALRGGQPGSRSRVVALLDVAIASGGLDLLVTAYRASPELLAVLTHDSELRERVRIHLAEAGDELLDESARLEEEGGNSTLSPREAEIYELLCEGLTNRQIGEILFISEKTVKVHVRHVYDKLGIRSRTAVALEAKRQAAFQAAPAKSSRTDASTRGSSMRSS